jgi:hypothetical protein
MVRGSFKQELPMTRQLKLQAVTAGRKPTHRLFCVVGDGDKANWTEIGALWPHKDGKGFSFDCKAMPIQGRMVARFISPRDEARGQQ